MPIYLNIIEKIKYIYLLHLCNKYNSNNINDLYISKIYNLKFHS